MAAWVLFSVLVFLAFGVPLIDEVYRLRVRRAASHARQAVQEHVSLVPDGTEENLLVSSDIASGARVPEARRRTRPTLTRVRARARARERAFACCAHTRAPKCPKRRPI